MPHYEHGDGGRVVMLCQVCGSRCHAAGPKKGLFRDPKESERQGRPVYRKGRCPLCVCHDCVQLADDPVRARLAPLMLGQTLSEGTNLIGDGKTEKRPGPFNIEKALEEVKDQVGLFFEPPPARHALPRADFCGCREIAKSRCISCNLPLCVRCLQTHRCLPSSPV